LGQIRAMQENAPTWDAADPAASLLRMAEAFNERARIEYLAAGTHLELFLVVGDDGAAGVVPVFGGQRDALLEALKAHLRSENSYGIIHIAEAWTYLRRSPDDARFDELNRGEVRVAELEKGERTEALVVRMESREGATRIWYNPILRGDGTVKLALADPIVLNEPTGGRLASFFP
jgi:hypothetical protein